MSDVTMATPVMNNSESAMKHGTVNGVELAKVALSFSRLLICDAQRRAIGRDCQAATDEHADQVKSRDGGRDYGRVAICGLPRSEKLLDGFQRKYHLRVRALRVALSGLRTSPVHLLNRMNFSVRFARSSLP